MSATFQCPCRPKVINAIHQKRVCSRDNLRAVGHVLEQIGLGLDDSFPNHMLRGATGSEKRFLHKVGNQTYAYFFDADNNRCRWEAEIQSTKHRRIVLSPDEGGPLYCAYIHLAKCGSAVHFQRDELQLIFSSQLTQLDFILSLYFFTLTAGTSFTAITNAFATPHLS